MSPITVSVNGSDNYVREFDASTCSGDNVYGIFEIYETIITEDSIIFFYPKICLREKGQ